MFLANPGMTFFVFSLTPGSAGKPKTARFQFFLQPSPLVGCLGAQRSTFGPGLKAFVMHKNHSSWLQGFVLLTVSIVLECFRHG